MCVWFLARTDYEGEWLPLAGPKPNLIHSPPELLLSYTFEDDKRVTPQPRGTTHGRSPLLTAAMQIDVSPGASEVEEEDGEGRDPKLDFTKLAAAKKESDPFVVTGHRGGSSAALCVDNGVMCPNMWSILCPASGMIQHEVKRKE